MYVFFVNLYVQVYVHGGIYVSVESNRCVVACVFACCVLMSVCVYWYLHARVCLCMHALMCKWPHTYTTYTHQHTHAYQHTPLWPDMPPHCARVHTVLCYTRAGLFQLFAIMQFVPVLGAVWALCQLYRLLCRVCYSQNCIDMYIYLICMYIYIKHRHQSRNVYI